MGWLGTLTGVGNVGTDLGTADTQERQFQLQKQQAQSEAAYKQALAQFNLGNLSLEQQKFAAGRWSVDNSNPYISNPDGSVSLVEHDRNGGAPRLTPMPKGFQIPNSIGDLTATLRRNFPDATPDQIRDMVSYKLGLKSPWAALSPQTSVDANGNPVVGVLNKGTGVFTPSKTASGAPVSKPVPTKFQTVTDANGNPTIVSVPAFSKTGGVGATSAPVAGVGRMGSGMTKSFAQLSPPAQQQITRISSTTNMLQDLQGMLEQKDANGVPLYAQGSQGAQKLDSLWQNFLYDHGLAGDKTWQQLIQEGTLADFTGVMGLIPGLRRGDLISQAMSHLPERSDSMVMMHQKAIDAQRLLRGSAQTIIRAEQQNRRGNLMNSSPADAAAAVTAPLTPQFGGTLTPPASASQQTAPPQVMQLLAPQIAAKGLTNHTLSDGSVWQTGNGSIKRIK